MASDRFLLLERSGNNKSNTSVFEMRLVGKKVHIRSGNKGQKLAKKIYKKQSISEALALFTDKRKQKVTDGYRIVKEQNKKQSHPKQNAAQISAISGKSITNPHNLHQNGGKQKKKTNANALSNIREQFRELNVNNVPQAQESAHSDEESQGRLKRGHQMRQNKHRKNKQKHKMKQKHGKGQKQNKMKHKAHHKAAARNNKASNAYKQQETESSVSSSVCEQEEYDQENDSQTANGNRQINGNHEYHIQDGEESEFNSAINSVINSEAEEETDDNNSEEEQDTDAEADESGSSSSSSSSSVQSGRSSDSEYEMDYEKMSHVMNDALNQNINEEDLEWKPLKVWIRYNEYHDKGGEYAMAPQIERIAGSCHELLVVYMRSSSFAQEKNVIYKRLLKLARDPEEDNKHHFDTERRVSQYLSRMASMVNHTFISRNDVCIWPVETVQFEYNGELKWATIQSPFLPDPKTNNIFVKIEPNSGAACVSDPIVGRYQHLFAGITRGLDLIRDWQGYGVSQHVFLDVCGKFSVQKEAIGQIKVRKNERVQKQTQVLVVIDPVLTTYNAHYETNNPTDFGVKAIDEWKAHHDCVRCRCKYFDLLSTHSCPQNEDGMQFGIADIDQLFFDKNTQTKDMRDAIAKCRYDLNIWCGDDVDGYDDDESENKGNATADTQQ